MLAISTNHFTIFYEILYAKMEVLYHISRDLEGFYYDFIAFDMAV